MRETVVMLLAGGGGTRLSILAHLRAKPAVPFGGMYRIIDFTLSNVMNSGIGSVAVLTQYKPLSLMSHLGTGEPWDMVGRTRGIKILPPRTGEQDSDWYRGTADAIRQNFDYLQRFSPENVLLLSGDHIYYMDYAPMIRFHRERRADVTIAMRTVAWEETRHFGIARTDADGRIVEWQEKPETASSNLASMGIYVFDARYLVDVLRGTKGSDFGNDIIPAAIREDRVYAYPFEGYWRDVGTIQSYWEANRDLLVSASGLDLHKWRVRTNLEEVDRLGDRPPARIAPGGRAIDSVLGPGCVIEGEIVRSVLSPGVRVERGARVVDSVLMHDVRVAEGATAERVIADKNVIMARGARVGAAADGAPPNRDYPAYLYTGLTVIGKGAAVPGGCSVGPNSIIYPKARVRDFPGRAVEPGSTIRASEP
jgi:glucose-1-phosphate adenylyltransferase